VGINHVHGVIVLNDVGAIHESPPHELPCNSADRHDDRGAIHESPPHELPRDSADRHDDRGAIRESPLQERRERTAERRRMTIPLVVGRFKTVSAKRINLLRQTPGVPVWQRNYYEHIVRDDAEMERIRLYIADNPRAWAQDRENPSVVGAPLVAASDWEVA